MKMKFLILFAASLLAACAPAVKESGIATEKDVLPACANPYVVLPGNYMIDLAAGSEVILNPDIHNFALFCEAAEAKSALENDLDLGRVRRDSDWKIYRLEGDMGQISRKCGADQYCLDQPAKIIEWLN